MKLPKLLNLHRPSNNQSLGFYGEDLATAFLRKKRFRILKRNFKARYGEIDIIAIDRDTLVFVEVKTRIGREYGLPEESVTPRKIRELKKTAEYYKLKHPELPELLRLDVVAIELDEDRKLLSLRHIPNASQ